MSSGDQDGAMGKRFKTSTSAMFHYGISFIGFTCFISWLMLHEGFSLVSDAYTYNYYLYSVLFHISSLLIVVLIGLKNTLYFSRPLFFCLCILCSAGAIAFNASSEPAIKIASTCLSSITVTALFFGWGAVLKNLHTRMIYCFVLGAGILATLLNFLCMQISYEPAILTAALLPILSGIAYLSQGRHLIKRVIYPSKISTLNYISHIKKYPWPFLLLLATCCLVSSLFSGMTLYPYMIQSSTITYIALALTIPFFGLLVALSVLSKNPKAQTFFLVPLGLLLLGLVLFSTGTLGSITVPLGLILAAKISCYVLAWITLAQLARSSSLPSYSIFGIGMIFLDGTLSRGLGVYISESTSISFTAIGTAASVCVALFTLFYAVIIAVNKDTNKALNPDLNRPLILHEENKVIERAPSTKPSPDEIRSHLEADKQRSFEKLELTTQERNIAELILAGRTYAQIALQLNISERTVKFHTKNIYTKANVSTRSEFQASLGSSHRAEPEKSKSDHALNA